MYHKAAEWFHSKWGYRCLDGDRIVGGLGVIENDFHSRSDHANLYERYGWEFLYMKISDIYERVKRIYRRIRREAVFYNYSIDERRKLLFKMLNHVIVYCDGEQTELSAILNAVFSFYFSEVEFRKAEFKFDTKKHCWRRTLISLYC